MTEYVEERMSTSDDEIETEDLMVSRNCTESFVQGWNDSSEPKSLRAISIEESPYRMSPVPLCKAGQSRSNSAFVINVG